MRRKLQKYVLIIIISAGYSLPVTGQNGGFMSDEGNTDPIPGDFPISGSDGAYTSGSSGSSSSSYTEDKPKGDKDKDKKKAEPSTTTDESSDDDNQPEEKEIATPVHAEKKAPVAEHEEDPASVLSFNFLHYMIQKFKFTDMTQ